MPFDKLNRDDEVQSDAVTLILPQPYFVENKRVQDALDAMYRHPQIQSLLKKVWLKDPYTYTHSHRVADLAQWLGQHMNLSPQERVEVYITGLLHDIGKIFTPDDVLKKPTRLSQDEFLIMKKHPEDSAKIVNQMSDLAYLEKAVLSLTVKVVAEAKLAATK
jgi:HD-GYP domain-containing protein (c-di-GMP phosphodiesterase class II)